MQTRVGAAGLAEQIEVSSAGTAAFHVGDAADARSRATARERGVELKSRALKFLAADFRRFDYVLAMDEANRRELADLASDEDERAKLHLLRDFEAGAAGSGLGLDVPDPYYGDGDGFERVFDICETGCCGLLEYLVEKHALVPAPAER